LNIDLRSHAKPVQRRSRVAACGQYSTWLRPLACRYEIIQPLHQKHSLGNVSCAAHDVCICETRILVCRAEWALSGCEYFSSLLKHEISAAVVGVCDGFAGVGGGGEGRVRRIITRCAMTAAMVLKAKKKSTRRGVKHCMGLG
jgi:hypothetical protein